MFEIIGTIPTDNKWGIDPLNIMIHFMDVLGCKNPRTDYDRFKSYLVSQIKREITKQEELNLTEGIYKYIMSEPGSNERMESIKYLFELQFLE